MFRLWGRIWKDNHMLKDTVICDDRQETRTHKVFYAWNRFVMNWILAILSGLKPLSGISRSTARHGFIRITLLSRLTSITWKSR